MPREFVCYRTCRPTCYNSGCASQCSHLSTCTGVICRHQKWRWSHEMQMIQCFTPRSTCQGKRIGARTPLAEVPRVPRPSRAPVARPSTRRAMEEPTDGSSADGRRVSRRTQDSLAGGLAEVSNIVEVSTVAIDSLSTRMQWPFSLLYTRKCCLAAFTCASTAVQTPQLF
eukprot:4623149-Amphidinium_carterae.1